MVRFHVAIILCALALAVRATDVTTPPVDERRVALVIGNSAYQDAPLQNPLNDAADIAAKLRARGFVVIERNNLKTSQIGRTLREFRAKLTSGAVALVFYAGHGLQIKGENYLPTVDAIIEGEEDVPNQSLSIRQILELLDESKTRLNLVFLDACRNNPFNRRFRSASSGLARQVAPSGTLISFATRPGSIAADGDGRNGLYTRYLIEAMDVPNLAIELALKRVVSGVKAASKGQQEPWMEGSIEGEFYFLTRAEPPAPSPAMQQAAIDRAIEEALRRSSEAAARERAEMQAAMERLLKESLAKQQAALEAERRARAEALAAEQARPFAMLSPATPQTSPAASKFDSAPGEEWEYSVIDEMFGKRQKLVMRVQAVSPAGVLEALIWNGKPRLEWVFGTQAAAIGTPNEAEFLFAPHWDGKDLGDILVEGGTGMCITADNFCKLEAHVTGEEQLTVPAGTFSAVRIDGQLKMGNIKNYGTGQVTIWYSKEHRRLLKQTAYKRYGQGRFKETIELSAIRPAQQ
ncbi:MAG: caspase family protein [Pseudomonadota bacterium]